MTESIFVVPRVTVPKSNVGEDTEIRGMPAVVRCQIREKGPVPPAFAPLTRQKYLVSWESPFTTCEVPLIPV
jgi:hypothetical protein